MNIEKAISIKRLLLIICLAGLLAGCKPTEKNYQAAYQVAQNKRKAERAADPDMALPANALQRMDGIRTKNVNGEELMMKRVFIKFVGKGEAPEIKKMNVAVAKYKMPTNAVAQTEDLVNNGLQAFPVESADGSFYVIAATFPTLEEAAEFVKSYKKNHDAASFVGLEGAPLIIER